MSAAPRMRQDRQHAERPTTRRFGLVLAVALAPLLVAGCAARVGPAVEVANIARDKAIIQANRDAAEAGDAAAQFKLGDAYCCAPGGVQGLYNNQQATAWLCRAARQDYAPAQYKLGQIYSGDVVDGVRIIRRVVTGVVGSDQDRIAAALWFSVAARQGYEDAAERGEASRQNLSAAEARQADVYLADWRSAPCEWPEVFELG